MLSLKTCGTPPRLVRLSKGMGDVRRMKDFKSVVFIPATSLWLATVLIRLKFNGALIVDAENVPVNNATEEIFCACIEEALN